MTSEYLSLVIATADRRVTINSACKSHVKLHREKREEGKSGGAGTKDEGRTFTLVELTFCNLQHITRRKNNDDIAG